MAVSLNLTTNRVPSILPTMVRPRAWDAILYARAIKLAIAPSRLPDMSGVDLEPGRIAELDGLRVRMHPELSAINRWRLAIGSHTRPERRLIAESLQPDDVVMELGSGIGLVSAACARVVGSEHVHTYEANPALRAMLDDTMELNGVAPEINMCLLGPAAGTTTFYVAEAFSDSSLQGGAPGMVPISVPVRPMAEELARVRPSYLIVDIEGAELELFNYTDLTDIRAIMLEVHVATVGATRTNRLRAQLRRQGFDEYSHDGQCFLYQRPTAGP